MSNENKNSKSLIDFSTKELVNELQKRQGVETSSAMPYEDISVSVNGPATILVVID